MAECYRCGKKIDLVVYCPYCGAKQRSSIELYGLKEDAKPEPPTLGDDERFLDAAAKPAEAKAEKPEATPPAEPAVKATIPALPETPKPKPFVIGKDFALWIIFIIVVIAFILAVIRFWQDIVIMP